MSKHRSDERFPVKIKVDFTSSASRQSIFSMNISAGGMFLSTSNPLPVGSRILLQMNLPNVDSTIEVMGEVVWNNTHPGGQIEFPEGMGIRFLNLDSLVRENIGTFHSSKPGTS